MLRWGIAYYRLPEDTLDREIRTILSLGIDVCYNMELGRDFTIQSLKREGYKAIFIGIGAQKSSRMAIPGEDLPGVMTGLDLLTRLARNEKPDLGNCIVVFGGGYRHGCREERHPSRCQEGYCRIQAYESRDACPGYRD